MIGTIGAMGLLTVGSFFDIRWKRIPVVLLLAGGAGGILCLISDNVAAGIGAVFLSGLVGILPGVGMFLLSLMTEKKVGSGDGFVLMVLGLLQGIGMVLLVFCVGLFLQSLWAVALLVIKRADKQTCIPFLPFLLAGELVICFL